LHYSRKIKIEAIRGSLGASSEIREASPETNMLTLPGLRANPAVDEHRPRLEGKAPSWHRNDRCFYRGKAE